MARQSTSPELRSVSSSASWLAGSGGTGPAMPHSRALPPTAAFFQPLFIPMRISAAWIGIPAPSTSTTMFSFFPAFIFSAMRGASLNVPHEN